MRKSALLVFFIFSCSVMAGDLKTLIEVLERIDNNFENTTSYLESFLDNNWPKFEKDLDNLAHLPKDVHNAIATINYYLPMIKDQINTLSQSIDGLSHQVHRYGSAVVNVGYAIAGTTGLIGIGMIVSGLKTILQFYHSRQQHYAMQQLNGF